MEQATFTEISGGPTDVAIGLGAVRLAGMSEMVAFADRMADSGAAIPPHLRGQPGTCLAIVTKAMRFGFDPFTLAEHSFLTTKGYGTEQEETIAYDSFVIRSIINAHAPITGGLTYSYSGEGMERTCTVTAVPKAGGEPVSLTSPPLGELIAVRMVDGVLRGSSLWETKPDQQMGYDTARDFCRLHHPEILMGWYDKDELTAKRTPKPKPQVAARLAGQKGDGFNVEGLVAALGVATGKPTIVTSLPAPAVVKARKAAAKRKPRKKAKKAKAAPKVITHKPPPAAFVMSKTETAMTAPLRSEF